MYKFLCGHLFSFIFGIYMGVEYLCHLLTLCLTFLEIVKLYSEVAELFYNDISYI